jgi:hypothetical protein
MKNLLQCILFLFFSNNVVAQQLLTPFEKSDGAQTATYFEAIAYYKKLAQLSTKIKVLTMRPSDAGYNLNLVLFASDGNFNIKNYHLQGKVIVLINNGIHPGEPDGIDASMLLVRDLANGTIKAPPNVVVAVIPVYNIGGCLNRGTSSRANQNGPLAYGFRGNSQNLDLNRDFTKNDSKEAKSFAQIFHLLDPDILIDNHVSDGADYQHTITLITTQYNKLDAQLGQWLKTSFEPGLYQSMAAKKWDLFPYVNFETETPEKGMEQFYDPPRYSTGYAALWQCIAFMPETHMLKPFKQRVLSTYDFSLTVIEQAALKSKQLLQQRAMAIQAVKAQTNFSLAWKPDTTVHDIVNFKGYQAATKTSSVTGLQRMYYDKTKPFEKPVKFFNTFKPTKQVDAPLAYIIPQGWQQVVDLLAINCVQMQRLAADTVINVTTTRITDYKAAARPYEKHHFNSNIKTTSEKQLITFLKGDYLIFLNQRANRFLVEMLEPTGDDSYFAWNYFDAILQQKEGYSDYRWEDVAAEVLAANPMLKVELEQLKKADTTFANNAAAQLNWVYKHSTYYEPIHMRYPVYQIVK